MLHALYHLGQIFWMNKLRKRMSDDFVWTIPAQWFDDWAYISHLSVFILRVDDIINVLDEVTVLFFRFAQCLFYLLSVRNCCLQGGVSGHQLCCPFLHS